MAAPSLFGKAQNTHQEIVSNCREEAELFTSKEED